MTSIAVRDPGWCPDCGATLITVTVAQPALVLHGGYGGTLTTTTRHCPACSYSVHQETTEARP